MMFGEILSVILAEMKVLGRNGERFEYQGLRFDFGERSGKIGFIYFQAWWLVVYIKHSAYERKQHLRMLRLNVTHVCGSK